MLKKLLLLIILLLSVNLVSSVNIDETYQINLLSVSIGKNESIGHIGKLYLNVKPGSGSVFIESYPLSKIDTQLSTKLGNDIACSLSQKDCSKYDFFYTIKVDSSIVSGPSAGSAITLVTLSALEDVKLPNNFAMTGMITSGGVITPVDSIKEKVEAASKDLDLVLIPEFALGEEIFSFDNVSNETLTMDSFSELDIEVIAVKNVWEALAAVSDYTYNEDISFEIPSFYKNVMQETNNKLCQRTSDLLDDFEMSNETNYLIAQDYYNLSMNATKEGNYYSSASYCYSANLRLRELQLSNLSQENLHKNYLNLLDSHKIFFDKINDYELETFTDLETYMIVMERLIESKDTLDSIDEENISYSDLAFAIERFYSAVAWSAFFNQEGLPLNLDSENLNMACAKEIEKADMIKSYLALFVPASYLEDITIDINHATQFGQQGNYPLCLYTASKAKVSGDFFLTSIGVYENETVIKTVKEKLKSAERIISSQHSFPMMGYSYIEYSKSLLDKEPQSALMFSEFAISFSDLSGYFPKEKEIIVNVALLSYIFIFIMGLIIGSILTLMFKKK